MRPSILPFFRNISLFEKSPAKVCHSGENRNPDLSLRKQGTLQNPGCLLPCCHRQALPPNDIATQSHVGGKREG